MGSASFTNLPRSTQLSAHSVYGRTAVPAGAGWGRSAALLVVAAGTEFLLPLLSVDPAAVAGPRPVIPESLLISTLQLLVSIGLLQCSRMQTQPRHVFAWSGASGVLLVFSFFISTIFILKISADYSRATVIVQGVSVMLAALCTRTIWFSLLQSVIASGLIDARRAILVGDPDYCLHFSARANSTGIQTIRSFDFPKVRTDRSASARPDAVQALPDARTTGYGEQAAPS
jgi:hypothetical protein